MTGSTHPNRDWEQWPGRGQPQERPRRGLRALFAPSADDVDAVEELLDAQGRELERRAASLGAAISDLEEREERVRTLRTTVEALLREGSAELDARHAELALAAQELADREQELSRLAGELEERRIELGAVELRRAAVERREKALDQRQAELERAAAEFQQRLARLEERESEVVVPPPPAAAASARPVREDRHLRVVPGDGYRLHEADGPAPAPGEPVELDGVRYRVSRVGPSPLPADDRRCAFLERP